MRDYITYAGNALNIYNMFITNAGVYTSPKRNFESIAIPGRSGNLIFENDGFENVEHTYPAAILKDFDKNFSALKSYLMTKKGYNRLVDTFHPDIFYLATFSRFDNLRQPNLKPSIGSFSMVFERKPQQYLVSGETPIEFTTNGQFLNPTEFEALPLIRVYGSGTLTINGTTITISTSSQYLDIDCEIQEVLQAGGNLDITLSNGEFPKLQAGINTVQKTSISKVVITPRWYRL